MAKSILCYGCTIQSILVIKYVCVNRVLHICEKKEIIHIST